MSVGAVLVMRWRLCASRKEISEMLNVALLSPSPQLAYSPKTCSITHTYMQVGIHTSDSEGINGCTNNSKVFRKN